MKNTLKNIINVFLSSAGLQIVRRTDLKPKFPVDYDKKSGEIIDLVRPFTMCCNDGLYTAIQAVKYVIEHKIVGDIVECGVWRGGCSMAMAQMLIELNSNDRQLWMFDTYEGMTAPTSEDVDKYGESASRRLDAEKKPNAEHSEGLNVWCYASMNDVRNNMSLINYPIKNIRLIKGDVLETLCKEIPDKIAILRLDTDWYESTKAELEILYPRLVKGGILIIDDYADWQGAKKAVDEYFFNLDSKPFLTRVDGSRVAVKV